MEQSRVRDYITGQVFALRRCQNCDAAQTEPVPRDLGPFYPPRYRNFGGLTARVLESLYLVRVRRWTRDFGRPGTALELGCGEGVMLAALRSHGWRVVGTERSTDAALAASRLHELPVFVGGLDAIGPTSRFELIIMFHVLEHLADPAATLKQCAALLSPRGRLVIGVPNRSSWQARVFGPRWFHLDVPRHLYHFSPRSITAALAASGLVQVGLSFASPEHDPYGWVQSTLNSLPFRQNELTRILMGMPRPRRSRIADAVMLIVAAPLALFGTFAAAASWLFGAGAVMEVWAAHAADE